MIPARKHRIFNAWFAAHARSRIQSTFGAVLAHGLDEARAAASESPLILVANHASWWDPLVILHASEHLLGVDGYAMMDAWNLREMPFFGLVGAFGVELDRPEDGTASIRYAARLLDRAGRAVWIFPQGRERPAYARPLGFRAGAAQIARVARRARVLPVAIRYEFAGEERPHLYLSAGAPLQAERDPDAGRLAQELAVTAELDRIDAVIGALAGAHDDRFDAALAAASAQGFTVVHRAQPSAVGQAAAKLLAHWTRLPTASTPRLPGDGHGGRS